MLHGLVMEHGLEEAFRSLLGVILSRARSVRQGEARDWACTDDLGARKGYAVVCARLSDCSILGPRGDPLLTSKLMCFSLLSMSSLSSTVAKSAPIRRGRKFTH